jgi:hypothetical protein
MYVELWREFGNPELDLMMTGGMHSGGIDGMMGMYFIVAQWIKVSCELTYTEPRSHLLVGCPLCHLPLLGDIDSTAPNIPSNESRPLPPPHSGTVCRFIVPL